MSKYHAHARYNRAVQITHDMHYLKKIKKNS